jgi:signal transduction histidine kinase
MLERHSHEAAETCAPLAVNVNDTPAARYLVSRILKSIGIEVVEAATGAEALEICEKRRPELVVLDIRLPDMTGYEVCRRIKDNPATSSIAILQTSATFVTGEGKARGLDSGAEAYLMQPFETVELIAMVRSLLRLKKTEQDAEARATALAVADRRKDEFLAMLAHELRNPLSAILVATNLLERPEVSRDQISRFSGTIARQARHLGRLVDDLLDVSRITRDRIQLTKKPFDLKLMVQNVLEASAPMLERRHHRLAVELPDRPLFVEADATRIEQVISNLLANAIKYTDSGGRITVSLEAVGLNGSSRAVVRVRDSGVGIAKENLESVWDLFYQVDQSLAPTQSGLGVGLTMVRRLVEMHGGKVGVRSEGLGAGAEVWFELPTVEEPERMSVVPQLPRKASRSLKILIVDDNTDSCELYRLAFQQDGHLVDAAFDGQAGIDKALAAHYDIAVVDIGLPVLNGYEVARRLQTKLGPACPFLIALTGYGRPEDRARAMTAGFAVHCVKPLDVREVTRLFERASATS